jgi:predicted RNase H-like HicB family nuclease
MEIEVMLDHDGDAWGAFAESPDIHGFVTATANSREAVLAEFESALRFHVAGLRADGTEMQDVTELAIREIVETRELAAA